MINTVLKLLNNTVLKILVGALLIALVVVGCDNWQTERTADRQRKAYADTVAALRQNVHQLKEEKAEIKNRYHEAIQQHNARLAAIDSAVATMRLSAQQSAVRSELAKLGLLRQPK